MMKTQENELVFVQTGRPRIIPGPFSNKGWKKYSFDVFNNQKEKAGLLEVSVSQRPENATSMRLYLYDSDDHKSARIFDTPVLYPPKRKDELFEEVQDFARECYEMRFEQEPVDLEHAAVNA